MDFLKPALMVRSGGVMMPGDFACEWVKGKKKLPELRSVILSEGWDREYLFLRIAAGVVGWLQRAMGQVQFDAPYELRGAGDNLVLSVRIRKLSPH